MPGVPRGLFFAAAWPRPGTLGRKGMMSVILAIDTATDACSVALGDGREFQQRYEVIPRRHNQRLFPMLAELLPPGGLAQHGVLALAYGCGPGSFTGLRVAASAVQGLAFASGLPCIPVSTLLCQAQGALRQGLINADDRVLSTVDAAIGELYHAEVLFRDGLARLASEPAVSRPEDMLPTASGLPLQGIGTGLRLLERMPAPLRQQLLSSEAEWLPAAADMLPLAWAELAAGRVQAADAVAPVYVRDEISWKKLSEQGKAD
jgi:tRNA threonylcarbamoyladenosine biosynthesis protein TsaB